MTSPPVDPVASDPGLPDHVDAVVIGAGIVGAAAALDLAEKGLKVALVEKGTVGGEQSSRNWGWCRQQGRDRREIPLIKHSLAAWGDLAERTGRDPGFRRTGVIWVTDDPKRMAEWEGWVDQARQHQIDTRLLSRAEIAARLPDARAGWIGGIETPSDGRAEPSQATPAIAEAARAKGAAILTGCAVRGLETEAGAVSAVVTERGSIRARLVLLAGGAWSNLFLKRHGLSMPQLCVRASAQRTDPAAEVTPGGLGAPDFSLRRREDGGYSIALGGGVTFDIVPDAIRHMRLFWPAFMAERKEMRLRLGRPFLEALFQRADWSMTEPGPFEACRTLDPEPDRKVLDHAFEAVKRAFPKLSDLTVAQRWAGMIDVTPDAVPAIGPVDALPGLHIATGFSGHGFGIGPGAGRLAADLLAGDAPIVDPEPFRFSRFHDGTKLTMDGGL
ncbi:FAD-binding oxidoreductase [Marivibrio halodurans]|uniref:FAD-binding oxidoreductase n=1 Tax=Marivibrio halodurans TaxID=2039722 RepID=A0A8J7S6Q9_9PROT|nr:FAD-binding oxidoreductase [Marivibrio halodurans]MBP5857814.1 FAD-binding oxidoreductase [Marivibrio halodurans]